MNEDGLTKALSLISHKAYFSDDGISERGCFTHFISCDNFGFQLLIIYIAARNIFIIQIGIHILF